MEALKTEGSIYYSKHISMIDQWPDSLLWQDILYLGYVMQLVVAATNQNTLYKKHMFCGKNVNKIEMRVHIK
jgi:hypothetical protein